MAEKSNNPENKFVRHKRSPPRQMPKQKNDIYVNKRSNFKCQLERAQKLLDSGTRQLHLCENFTETHSYPEVYIHGLGAAINRAINLTLQLQQKGHGSIELSAQTSSVQLVDDFEPLDDEGLTEALNMFDGHVHVGDHEGYSQLRTNSSIKIKVYKVHSDELGAQKT